MAGYKTNAQKPVAFLYTNDETEEREIKESIPFTVAPKSIRYLGINLTKEVKDLYPKNYRTLLKEIEEDLSLIHISEPTRLSHASRMPSSA